MARTLFRWYEQVKKHGESGVSFVLVREAKHFGDDQDKDEQVLLHSKMSDKKPYFKDWLYSLRK